MNTRRLQSRTRRAGPARSFEPRSDAGLEALLAAGFIHPVKEGGLAARVDRYKVFGSVGAGSMGTVVWGWDPWHDRRVAIKFLRPELADLPGLSERFLLEAGHLERLRHPRIVPVISVSNEITSPYFVMPFLEQGSLADKIRERSRMTAARVLGGASQIAEALAHAHQAGVIHRDVKPSNVLIDDQGRFCLADFGLASIESNDSASRKGVSPPEGTAAYMSPAVAAGETEGAPGDIYALGALLYEMLTGSQPYRGRTAREVVRRVLAGPPVPLRKLNPRTPAGLAVIIEGAMARNQNDRYPSMSRLLADLNRISDGEAPWGAARLRPFPKPFGRR